MSQQDAEKQKLLEDNSNDELVEVPVSHLSPSDPAKRNAPQQKRIKRPFHCVSAEGICFALRSSSETGLSSKEVQT